MRDGLRQRAIRGEGNYGLAPCEVNALWASESYMWWLGQSPNLSLTLSARV